MIRIIVNGADGRMGRTACQHLSQNKRFLLVAETGRKDPLAKIIRDQKADVVVDFTRPDSAYQNTLTIIKSGARPVIGTTGLSLPQVKKLQTLSLSLKRGGIIAPNFSIGMALMVQHAQALAKYFPQIEIIEMHHDKKKDSPSGTALFTAERLNTYRNKEKIKKIENHETVKGARGANYLGIPIHAIRLPGFLAHEQILFGDLGETLTLRHDATDRVCFMRGLILACEKVVKLKRLVYGLEEIL